MQPQRERKKTGGDKVQVSKLKSSWINLAVLAHLRTLNPKPWGKINVHVRINKVYTYRCT